METSATRGIILRQTKYSESSVILKIYTEQSGLQSYILRGVRKKNRKTGMAVLQPMTLVYLVPSLSTKSELKYIKEIQPVSPYNTIPFDHTKSSVLIFLNEILNQVILEETENQALFSFLFHSLEFFDQYDGPVANFHLLFLLQLTRYLGIYPRDNYSTKNRWFSIEQGEFTSHKNVLESESVSEESASALSLLLRSDYQDLSDLKVTHSIRLHLNTIIMSYYKYHNPNFRDLKSLEVIQMVISE